LRPDGTGGVLWGGGVDGTKGGGSIGTSSGSPTQIAIVSGAILQFKYRQAATSYILGLNDINIDSSDDTFSITESIITSSATSAQYVFGTLTASFVLHGLVYMRKNGSNYEFYSNSTQTNLIYSYLWV